MRAIGACSSAGRCRAFTPPMLATLAKEALSDPAWVYEPKLDGQRSPLWRRRSAVRLITRNEKDRTSHYPDLVEALLRHESSPLIADGECPGMRWRGTSFFSTSLRTPSVVLQDRISSSGEMPG
jgi:ATP-dependent DNA ligase